jgi:LysR family hydrogen peroxide-inducible transcriptional activator
MEIAEVRYFLVLARVLNFTRAAQECKISQPALTRAIQKLEVELGGALFLRHPGNVQLTALGQALVPRFEAIAVSVQAARESAIAETGKSARTLRLGVMCTIGPARVGSLVAQLLEEDAGIEVTLEEATSREIIDLVASDAIDIGIAAWTSYPDTIAVRPLFEERFAIAFHPGHVLAGQKEVPLHDLHGCDYLERLACEFDQFYSVRIGEWPIDLRVRFSSEREDWIQSLLAAGLGASVVPEFMALSAGIVRRRLVDPVVTREVGLLTLRGKPLPMAAQTFIRIAARQRWTGEDDRS